jgi:hypothetical protein
MRRYYLVLALIAFLAAAQCQESNTLDAKDDAIESNLSISLTSFDTKCNETAQFCPGGNVTATRLETFKIDAKNEGEEPISELVLTAMMPKGMKYIDSSYLEKGGGRLEDNLTPPEFNETQNTSIEWYIGDLEVNETISILLRTYLRCSVNRTQIDLNAQGYISNNFVNIINDESINLTNCNCTSESTYCNRKSISEPIDPIAVDISVYEANSNARAFFSSYSEPARIDIYNITVTNRDIPLEGVELNAVIGRGMMFKNTANSDSRRGRLNVERDPIVFDEDSRTFLTWKIGNLLAGETRSIILEAYLKENVNNTDIYVVVYGYIPDLLNNEPLIGYMSGANKEPCHPSCPNWEVH